LRVVEKIRIENLQELAARAGVATGQVVVGDLVGESSREKGAVAGDTPNLAARLQELADPGTLMIAETTHRLVRTAFDTERIGPAVLKGLQRKVEIFRVVRERHVDSRYEAAQGDTNVPLVGRFHEFGMLSERWALAQAGQGQVVLISGEPGIGKSRLVEAFCDSLEIPEDQLVRMQCSPYLRDSAYHPLIERLSRAAGFSPADPASERLRKLESLLDEGGAELTEIIPVYAELLSIALDERYRELQLQPQALRDLTLKTLVERFETVSRRGPAFFVLEDAHWIDPSTQELLERLLPHTQTMPALLVITHRPEWSSDWAAAYSNCTSISIGRIRRDQVQELIEAVTEEAWNDTLIDEIIERTDGVPLFVVELARAIAEAGSSATDGREIIPATLQGSLMARLDYLPADLKSIAQTASIIGRDFDGDLLAKIVGVDRSAMRDAISRLQQSQIIVRSPVSAEAFTFRHALIQDAAYQSLLTSRRRAYHDIIAETLVADYPDISETQPELVARHFMEADRPDDALPLWKLAAKRALARSANSEAVRHSEHAFECAQKLSDSTARSAELLATELLRSNALMDSGQLAPAMAAFLRAVEQARDLEDGVSFAEAVTGFDEARFLANEHDDASVELLEEALAMAERSDGRVRSQLMGRLARCFLLMGNYEQARSYNDQAVELVRRLNDPDALFHVLVNDFLTPTEGRSKSDSDRLRALVEEILVASDRLGQAEPRGRALSCRAYFCAEEADRDGLNKAIADLAQTGEQREMMHLQWIAGHGQAMLAILDGDFANAEKLAEAAFEIGQQTHGLAADGVYGIQMFTIRREQGRLNEVAPVIKKLLDDNPKQAEWKPGFALVACDLGFTEPAGRMLSELAETGFSFPLDAKRTITLAYLAEICASLDEAKYAEGLYELVRPYRHMTITAGVMTVCYGSAGRFLGQLATVLGDWDRAEEHFETALAMNKEMGAWPWLAHGQHAYATMLQKRSRTGDADKTQSLLEQAQETANRMGMAALQAKLKRRLH
ncbi:MAG: ATP-binding protein, partial [Hyphomicrobiaceae bacterium]